MVADILPGLANAPYVVSAWLLTYAFHSTVLIGGAWLAAVVLARVACRSPRVRVALPALREKLWKCALVGGLATASLQTVLGLDPWGARIALRSTETARVEAVSSATTDVVAMPFPSTATVAHETPTTRALEQFGLVVSHARKLDPTPRSPESACVDADRAPADPSASIASPTDVDTIPTSDLRLPTWVQVVVALWIAGVLFGLARWVCQWNRLLRRLDDRSPVLSGTVWEVYQHLRVRMHPAPNVRLSIAPGIRAPITLGLRRMEICLPPRVESELQRDEIAALLAHELAHARRRDPAWLALCRAIEVVFFFQPLNRVCASWLADEAEYLCDDWAIVHVGERVALASCLTEIAGWLVHDAEPRLAPGMAAAGTRLSLRVGRLLDEEHDPARAPRTRWVAAALVPGVLSVALLVPRVSADAAPDDEAAAVSPVASNDEATESRESPADFANSTSLADRTRELESALSDTTPAPNAAATTTSNSSSSIEATIRNVTPTRVVVTSPVDDIDTVLSSLSVELDRLRTRLDERGGCETIEAEIEALDERLTQLRRRAANVQARVAALESMDSWPEIPAASAPNSTPSFRSKD